MKFNVLIFKKSMNQPKMTSHCLNLINTECERVGITSGAAVYYKSNKNVDLPSTLLLLRKKLVISRSLRPDTFPRLVDRATISKNRYDALQPTSDECRAVTAIPNHAECAIRHDLDLEIE